MLRLQKAFQQFVTSVMAINVEVLGALIKNGILSNMNGSFVVTVKSDRK